MSAGGKANHLSDKHEWLLRTGTLSRSRDVSCQTVDALTVSSTQTSEQAGSQARFEHDRNTKWLEHDQDWADGNLDVSRVGLGKKLP